MLKLAEKGVMTGCQVRQRYFQFQLPAWGLISNHRSDLIELLSQEGLGVASVASWNVVRVAVPTELNW
jgi:hypothetical protein